MARLEDTERFGVVDVVGLHHRVRHTAHVEGPVSYAAAGAEVHVASVRAGQLGVVNRPHELRGDTVLGFPAFRWSVHGHEDATWLPGWAEGFTLAGRGVGHAGWGVWSGEGGGARRAAELLNQQTWVDACHRCGVGAASSARAGVARGVGAVRQWVRGVRDAPGRRDRHPITATAGRTLNVAVARCAGASAHHSAAVAVVLVHSAADVHQIFVGLVRAVRRLHALGSVVVGREAGLSDLVDNGVVDHEPAAGVSTVAEVHRVRGARREAVQSNSLVTPGTVDL